MRFTVQTNLKVPLKLTDFDTFIVKCLYKKKCTIRVIPFQCPRGFETKTLFYNVGYYGLYRK